MKTLMIFGKPISVVEKKDVQEDSATLKRNRIILRSCHKPIDLILKELLSSLLCSKLKELYESIKRGGKVEVFGNLDFNIVERIDGKKGRIAKLVGRNVLVKLNTIVLPKNALKYVIAHEVAHTITKKHGKNYWKILETIYPGFDDGKRLLTKYEGVLSAPLLNS